MTSPYRRLHDYLTIHPDYHLAEARAPALSGLQEDVALATLKDAGEIKNASTDELLAKLMAKLASLPWDATERIKRASKPGATPMQEYSAAVQSRIDRTREAIRKFPKTNNVSLAARLGCSVQTVRNHRRRMRAAGEVV